MPDTIDGDIAFMRSKNPNLTVILNGEIFRSREATAPKRESIFVWDPTSYVGPLYKDPVSGVEHVPQYVGFAPDYSGLRKGEMGVWRWMDPPAGVIDAERVYGVSPKASASDNAQRLQRCVDEVLASDATWPRPGNDPGEGDCWIVRLPAGTIRLDTPIVFNRKTEDTEGCDPGQEKVTVAGRIILQGQNLTTVLSYEGNTAAHAFLVGDAPGNRWAPGCVFRKFGLFGLRDLELQAATDAGFAVLRLWQAVSSNELLNVKVTQFGDGDGINASEVIFSRFVQVTVKRLIDTERYPNPTRSSGKGFWMHTDENPYYISGQSVLDRLSVFGDPRTDNPTPTNSYFFETGILIGDNQTEGKLIGSLSGQFINAEVCDDGIVFGKGAVNVDFSVV